MISAQIQVSQLTPQFTLPQTLTTATSLMPLLLGQERLTSAFDMACKIPNQHLYIADFQGLDRCLLIKALTERYTEKKYCYLSGNLRRQHLIGFKNTQGQWQEGELCKDQWLFICADALTRRENLWEMLFHCLEQGCVETADKQSFPLKAKIALIGNTELYANARYQEARFSRFFPLLGEMSHELDVSQSNIKDYCHYLMLLAQQNQLILDESSLPILCNYSAKLTEHQQKLSLLSEDLSQLLVQAASFHQDNRIDAKHVKQALEAKNFRHNASEIFSAQSFDDAFINLLTQGEAIGQINALTVIDAVDFSYGEPARITASVHYGDGEVADIERKSELGGNIHAKGMMILSSCLYRIFGKDAPLHLNANIVFEQSYQEIDGDSASLAEYCCLVSAIAEKPIRQSLAITGAVDQFGNVQAIGGINEKIEGFFNLCYRRGLTGEQGVILPHANLLQLNLPDHIVAAVAEQKFHLYQVAHIDEAVELLIQIPAGEVDKDNNFPEQSLYGMVQQRLDRLAGNFDEYNDSFWSRLKAKFGC